MTATAEKTTTENLPVPAAPAKVPLVAGRRPQRVGAMAIVPEDIEGVYRLATGIIRAGMSTKTLDTVDKAAIAIMHGLEVGLTPMASIQSIAVINGMPALWGDGVMAVVRGSGLLEEIIEHVDLDEKTGEPISATVTVKRKGQPQPAQQTFTRAMAQKAGLWRKPGPWQQFPDRMLKMRARSWVLRDTFADILRGLHSAEEVEDMPTVGSSSTLPPEPRRADYQKQATDVEDSGAQVEQQDQTSTGGQVAPAADESSGEANMSQSTSPEDPGTAMEAEGWPLFDAEGVQVGEFGVTEWLPEFAKLWPGIQTVKARRQYLDNNTPSAKSLLADDDVPESVKADLRKRFEAFLN